MKMKIDFSGQAAIVTGAGSGMGRATALLLASRGARVLVNDPGQKDGIRLAARVAEEISALGGKSVPDFTPVGTHEAGRSIVAAAKSAFGRVDVLINNAGIVRPGSVGKVPDEDIDRVHAVNLMGPYALLRAVWPVMVDQGYGRIVSISSSGALGSGISGPYASSKAGLIGLTKDAGIAGAPLGIRVNAVMPAASTSLMDNHPDPAYRKWFSQFKPEQVAAVTAFLSSRNVSCSGEIFAAGGGRVSRIAFMEGVPWFDPEITPEGVASNIEQIMSLDRGRILAIQADHQNYCAELFPGMPKV
jgi:NAD(P)-dependent dehydrogenase (short-subunit alcohol dehydrogenase family)